LAAEALLDGEVEALTRKAIETALAGDVTALRLCLERLVPPRRARPVVFELPPISTAEDVLTGMGAVLQAVSNGDLTPDEGQAVASLLEVHRRAFETIDIERRLTALEAAEPASWRSRSG
jgi:hypothetical protein